MILGIDIGTTTVKVVVIKVSTDDDLTVLFNESERHNAYLSTTSDRAEQDPSLILATLEKLIKRIPNDIAQNIIKIGVTGQMHGLVLWKVVSSSDTAPLLEYSFISSLVTWEDQRCVKESFMIDIKTTLTTSSSSSSSSSNCTLFNLPSSGYGTATLIWLAKYSPELLNLSITTTTTSSSSSSSGTTTTICAGTIQDFIVCKLANLKKVTMDPTNAHSWGLFDIATNSWDERIETKFGVPLAILPEIKPSGTVVGQCSHFPPLNPKASVYISSGDHPCSVFATNYFTFKNNNHNNNNNNTNDDAVAFLNIGTSSQFACLLPSSSSSSSSTSFESAFSNQSVEIRPFLNDKRLLVCASLNGGNVLDALVHTMLSWRKELDFSDSSEKKQVKDDDNDEIQKNKQLLFAKLVQQSLDCIKSSQEPSFLFSPTVFRERSSTAGSGSEQKPQGGFIENIIINNNNHNNHNSNNTLELSPVFLFMAACRGIISNLKSLLVNTETPFDIIEKLGVKEIVPTGSVFLKNPLLSFYIPQVFNVPVKAVELSSDVLDISADAAIGVALFVHLK